MYSRRNKLDKVFARGDFALRIYRTIFARFPDTSATLVRNWCGTSHRDAPRPINRVIRRGIVHATASDARFHEECVCDFREGPGRAVKFRFLDTIAASSRSIGTINPSALGLAQPDSICLRIRLIYRLIRIKRSR